MRKIIFSYALLSGGLLNLFVYLDLFIFSGEAHTKAQMVKAELELEVNKLRTEEAALRDSLLKMQALNEGLGQDKIELNKIIMQVGVSLFYKSNF